MAGNKKPYASFEFPEFRFFLGMRLALVMAWNMQFVVIEWEVYNLTHDPLSLGLLGLMEVVPALSIALFAGHIVDRVEKRSLLLKCLLAFVVISSGLFYLTSPLAKSLPHHTILISIYILVFFGGLIRAFFGPLIFTLFSLIVPKKLYSNAATWSSSAWQIGAVLGPSLGGFLIRWIGVHNALLVVVGLVIIAATMLLQIAPKPIVKKEKKESIGKSLSEGIRFVWHTKVILSAISLDMFAVLFGGAVALLPIYAKDILQVGARGFGFLRAAPAVGSFITMLAVAYFPLTKKAGYKLLAAVFGFGLSILVFGVSKFFYLSLLALFLSGVFDGVSVVIRQTILQLKTPDEMRGRVSAVNSMFVGSSNELGAFESGLTARLLGTVTAVVAGALVTISTVIVTGFTTPALRKLDLTVDENGDTEN